MPPSYDADIIILSLDRVADTLAAIASALAQSGLSRRVIVVDQGSRPENLCRLRRTLGNHPDVTLVCLPENLGVAGGAQPCRRSRPGAGGHRVGQ